MIGPILLTLYIALSGTIGAWWMASDRQSDDEEKVSLFDIAGHILPAIIFCWLIIPMSILERIKIKKFK